MTQLIAFDHAGYLGLLPQQIRSAPNAVRHGVHAHLSEEQDSQCCRGRTGAVSGCSTYANPALTTSEDSSSAAHDACSC